MDIDEQARAHIQAAIALISAIDDPAERDRRYAGLSRYLREEATAEIRLLRHAGVKALREQGLSHAQIGELLSLDRNRVSAMAAGRTGGGNRPKGEQLHHRDGDPRNNDVGNLEVRDQPEAPPRT